MRSWNAGRLLALILLVGVAVVSLRVLVALLLMGGLLLGAGLIVGVVLFTRWRDRRSSASPRPPQSAALG